ncbi:AAC(3)-I family aminoglycoside N-acetyltransferase [Roseospirillum parvum]|uniref:Aminoglycoside 3-N-acetyltransferase I n=1 Tax=Roseospirillum parvum TaxID=83401 RepID=A0A1G7Y7L0_9PROT|nr:AAC(3)-I family aminoglycoside N-acetyltransferase [Roseospirillum parvum]SDG92276.1 aminoglycoside 3-N-acetyltransferase I [Roseospirillum parvum]
MVEIVRLRPGDAVLFHGMLTIFADAFEEHETYLGASPGAAYRDGLLAEENFIALVAVEAENVIGALAGYELRKFERERSEFYIYDLAVSGPYRRRGVATAMIGTFSAIAKKRGAWVVFVQADHGDDAAIALYSKLGQREEALHFDIDPQRAE